MVLKRDEAEALRELHVVQAVSASPNPLMLSSSPCCSSSHMKQRCRVPIPAALQQESWAVLSLAQVCSGFL